MSRWQRALVWSFLCSHLWLVGLARAQEPAEPPQYRDTVREALAEYHAKNFPEARALFMDAHQLYPNARTLRGLGMTSFELRSYAEAIGYLREALASQVKPLEGGLRNETERLLRRAERFVAKVNVSVTPPNVRLTLDGEPRDLRPGEPILLDVGEHILHFEADGHVPETRTLHVKGRETETWSIVLNPVPAAPEPVVAAPVVPSARETAEKATVAEEEETREEVEIARTERPSKRPLYKNPWLWTGVGVAVAAVAVTSVMIATRDPGVADPQTSSKTPNGGVFTALWSRP